MLLVLVARVEVTCDGDVGCLVVAGTQFTDADAVNIPVVEGTGYDGQFFFRQAQVPFALSLEERVGVRFDSAIRPARILHPLLAWMVSGGGRESVVVHAMLLTSALAVGAVALVVATAARRAGRSAWWGLLASLIPGVIFGASRLVSDPLSAALIGGGALALKSRRWGWASVFLSFGVLTKEQALVLPFAYFVSRVHHKVSTRSLRPDIADLPWLVPSLAFLGWQLVLGALTGAIPAATSGQRHAVVPFTEMVPAVVDWVTPNGVSEVVWLIQLSAFFWLAAVVLRSSRTLGWERTFAAIAVLLTVSLSSNVFNDPSFFRQMADLTIVVIIAAFAAEPRRWAPALAVMTASGLFVIVRVVVSL